MAEGKNRARRYDTGRKDSMGRPIYRWGAGETSQPHGISSRSQSVSDFVSSPPPPHVTALLDDITTDMHDRSNNKGERGFIKDAYMAPDDPGSIYVECQGKQTAVIRDMGNQRFSVTFCDHRGNMISRTPRSKPVDSSGVADAIDKQESAYYSSKGGISSRRRRSRGGGGGNGGRNNQQGIFYQMVRWVEFLFPGGRR